MKSFFSRDTPAKQTIIQKPNAPLLGWLIFLIIAKIFESQPYADGFKFVSSAFLFTWAYLEIRSGANIFRRTLGLAVMTGLLISRF